MNAFWIMLDSLRREHVGVYGSKVCQTPHLDAFAQEAVIFDNAYPEALPTIPVRTAMVTGCRTLAGRPWQPLVAEDVAAAEEYNKAADDYDKAAGNHGRASQDYKNADDTWGPSRTAGQGRAASKAATIVNPATTRDATPFQPKPSHVSCNTRRTCLRGVASPT